MESLKSEFDTHFERLLEKLNTLTGEILLKCLNENPKKAEKDIVSAYFVKLQLEVTEKVQKLRRFQENLNSHCTAVHIKIDYADLSGPAVSQGPFSSGAVPRNHIYAPIHNFLPSERDKLWYTTASDFITDKDFSTILEWLRSGGAYTSITNPAWWVKLLLDQETSRSFDQIILDKYNTNPNITIDDMIEVLYELILSCRSVKSRRMSLFQLYNKPGMMGKGGDH